MSKKIPGMEVDENGIGIKYAKPKPVEVPSTDVSLDDIGIRIIVAMDRATKTLLTEITAGNVDRDTIGALKDIAMVLKDLKKDEKDYLNSLTDEQLAELSKK